MRLLFGQVGKSFDPHSDDFTLEKVLDLGLEHHQDTISALSGAAGKELAIEEAINKITAQWESLPLDLTEYKAEYLKLRSVDDLYSALDDNAVAISTMKASRYATSFLGELDKYPAQPTPIPPRASPLLPSPLYPISLPSDIPPSPVPPPPPSTPPPTLLAVPFLPSPLLFSPLCLRTRGAC